MLALRFAEPHRLRNCTRDEPFEIGNQAPAQCAASIEKPHDENFPASLRFDPSLITSEANKGIGRGFLQQDFGDLPLTRDGLRADACTPA